MKPAGVLNTLDVKPKPQQLQWYSRPLRILAAEMKLARTDR